MKLDITNWPTIREKKPDPLTIIILYREGYPYLLYIDENGNGAEDHCPGCLDASQQFKWTNDDIWAEIPSYPINFKI